MSILMQGKNMSKNINKKRILQNLNFTFYQQKTVAIIGANGSGKSTLLRILAGITLPSSGTIQRKHIRIGYVPEQFPPNIMFTGFNYLYHLGRIGGLSREVAKERVGQLFDQFNFTAQFEVIKYYSKGMRQKINIMQALLHQPSLLILDEPLSGLDESVQLEVESILYQLKQQGLTILFTCHDLPLVHRLADRTVTLQNGKLMESVITCDHVEESLVTIESTLPADVSILTQISAIYGIDHETIHKNKIQFTISSRQSDEIIALLIQSGASIYSVWSVQQKAFSMYEV
ncbi:ABC transporter ATP-binding protein [Virgibacillus sp.]|uniref:ABC transporter ATP-binding protein n=1 Tax=Virgibacillus sp. TaxID=1872700 RepID=UPI00179F2562|nr:ABC transporter ATP-binding protein [Virgibacillus sp.]NWO14355.1 ABC transporter ATP-binding protein [Virgibacillus sp.]